MRTTYSSIKVITVVGLIILGIVLDLGGETFLASTFNVTNEGKKGVQPTTALDSGIGNIQDRSINLVVSRAAKAGSSHGGL